MIGHYAPPCPLALGRHRRPCAGGAMIGHSRRRAPSRFGRHRRPCAGGAMIGHYLPPCPLAFRRHRRPCAGGAMIGHYLPPCPLCFGRHRWPCAGGAMIGHYLPPCPLALRPPPLALCRRGDDWPLRAAVPSRALAATVGVVPAGRWLPTTCRRAPSRFGRHRRPCAGGAMIGHYVPPCPLALRPPPSAPLAERAASQTFRSASGTYWKYSSCWPLLLAGGSAGAFTEREIRP